MKELVSTYYTYDELQASRHVSETGEATYACVNCGAFDPDGWPPCGCEPRVHPEMVVCRNCYPLITKDVDGFMVFKPKFQEELVKKFESTT